MRIEIPFGGASLAAEVDECRIEAIHAPARADGAPRDSAALVREALDNPAGSPPLRVLARGKRRIAVITSDHTRPLPSGTTLPPLLEEIRAGEPKAEIAIIVATGCHRAPTDAEMREKFGDALVDSENFAIHDARAPEDRFVDFGPLPSGAACRIGRAAAEADLLVAEGFIEPHFFAGFSGGRKAVLPGCADRRTVLDNHSAGLIASPGARTGVLAGNPIHDDMVVAGRRAGLAFILNVALDERKNIVAAFAGDMEAAHAAGCDFVRARCAFRSVGSDIVVTGNGGYPLDQNLYQAVKCLTAGEAAARPGGVIVAASECRDGHGSGEFLSSLDGYPSPAAALADISTRSPAETRVDQWQAQILFRVLSRFSVVMVTDPAATAGMVERLGMIRADSLEDGLRRAERIANNPMAGITVIPDGVGVIVEQGR